MTFNHHIEITSPLSKEQVRDRLCKNSVQSPEKAQPLFKGKVNQSNFHLVPAFTNGIGFFISPEIKGEIERKEKTTIKLSFELPTYLKLTFHGLLMLNILALIWSLSQLNFSFSFFSYVLGILLTIVIFYTVYYSVVRRALKILVKLLINKS